jgi:hypothetical protein
MEEDNTREIAEQIFSKPPGEPNTIDLSFHESTINYINQDEVHAYIRDVISIITMHGVEILFGHKNVMMLTEDQLFLVKQYTRSYGFDMTFNVENNTIIIGFKKIY